MSIYTDRRVEVSYRERKPENIKEAKRNYLTIDVFVDGRYSNQSTSDLRPAAVKDFISNAVVMTKMLAEDPFRSLPDSKYYKGRAETDRRDLRCFTQGLQPRGPTRNRQNDGGGVP